MNIDFTNPSPRLPLAIIADTSGSMGWGENPAIDLLNEGLKKFKEEIENDEIACMSLETSIINCGLDINVLLEFDNIYNLNIPKLKANGGTPLGESILLALETLEKRKVQYKSCGIQYYQPMLLIMTDGYPTTDTLEAIRKVKEKIINNKLSVVCLAIGDDADKELLKKFNNEVTTINKFEFNNFFMWLSQSVKEVSTNAITGTSYNSWKEF